jgi:hypothetical protein
MGYDDFFVSILNWKKMLVILVFLRHHHSKSAILYYPTLIHKSVIHKGLDVMSLFNTVHILQVVIFENMLAYGNVNSYVISDNSPHIFKKIGINRRKDPGHMPLKHIKPRFTKDYTIILQRSF